MVGIEKVVVGSEKEVVVAKKKPLRLAFQARESWVKIMPAIEGEF